MTIIKHFLRTPLAYGIAVYLGIFDVLYDKTQTTTTNTVGVVLRRMAGFVDVVLSFYLPVLLF